MYKKIKVFTLKCQLINLRFIRKLITFVIIKLNLNICLEKFQIHIKYTGAVKSVYRLCIYIYYMYN